MSAVSKVGIEEAIEVRAVLARTAAMPPGAGELKITRLPSLTNRTYLVERGGGASGGAYVLRLPGKGTELYIDRESEAANARAAASVGLTPAILRADPASGVMLSRYVAGAEPLSPERLREPDHLRAAVGLLRRLHGSGLVFRGEMRLYPKLDQYLALGGTPALKDLRQAGEDLRLLIERGWGPLTPCHIDPAPHNFIAAGARHFLLDWEYAAMCQPLWDLAGLSIEGRFDRAHDSAMLALYFGEASGAWMSRLHIYRIMLRLVAAAWGAVQIAMGNGRWTAEALIDPLVAASAADLASPDLGHHLEAAA